MRVKFTTKERAERDVVAARPKLMSNLAHTAPKTCEHCGALFVRARFNGRLEDRSAFEKRRFCSRPCFLAAGAHRNYKRPDAPPRALLKDSCEACGFARDLCAYRVDEDPANPDPANLQTLCRHCHSFWHRLRERLGLSVIGRMPALFPRR